MDKRVKQLLIEALESGDYQKTTGRLAKYDEDSDIYSYCCLGVLSDLAAKEGVCPQFQIEDGESFLQTGDNYFDRHSAYPPDSVRQWSGLDVHQQDALAALNDDVTTFGPVIDYIKENL